MNIALMSHDRKKELMVQFCIAYCGILSKHTICATIGRRSYIPGSFAIARECIWTVASA